MPKWITTMVKNLSILKFILIILSLLMLYHKLLVKQFRRMLLCCTIWSNLTRTDLNKHTFCRIVIAFQIVFWASTSVPTLNPISATDMLNSVRDTSVRLTCKSKILSQQISLTNLLNFYYAAKTQKWVSFVRILSHKKPS